MKMAWTPRRHGRFSTSIGPDDHRERALELDGLFSIWGEGSNAAYR